MNHSLIIDIETINGNNYEQAMQPFIEPLAGKRKKVTKASNNIDEFLDEGDKYQEALKKCALSPIGGRIACIGVLEDDELSESKWHFIYDENENTMLLKLQKLIKPQTQLITFNGRAFDFPFLMFRAAIHRVFLSLDIYPYNKDYGKGNTHIDMKVHLETISCLGNLSSDWSVIKTNLGEWLRYFGIGDKLSIKAGDISIEDCIKTGNIEKLEQYSKNDVMKTYELYKIFEGNF